MFSHFISTFLIVVFKTPKMKYCVLFITFASLMHSCTASPSARDLYSGRSTLDQSSAFIVSTSDVLDAFRASEAHIVQPHKRWEDEDGVYQEAYSFDTTEFEAMRRSLLVERLGERSAGALFAREEDPDYWLCKGQFSTPLAYSATLSGVAGLVCRGFAWGLEMATQTQIITRYNLQATTGERLKLTVKYTWQNVHWAGELYCAWLVGVVVADECTVREHPQLSPWQYLGLT